MSFSRAAPARPEVALATLTSYVVRKTYETVLGDYLAAQHH